MGNNETTIGNGQATAKLIADSFSVVVDPQVTINQLWNLALLTANRNGADVVGSVKHDTYPQGFTGVVLLLDGHIALQYGVDTQRFGNGEVYSTAELNVLICTNGGPQVQEKLRSAYNDAYIDLLP